MEFYQVLIFKFTQPVFTCSKSTMETLEYCVKPVQSINKDT